MEYKLRKQYSTDENEMLREILLDRNVEDVETYITPTADCECDPHLLLHIKKGANMLLKHVNAHNKIGILVDSDCDGFTSSAIIWNYLKELDSCISLTYFIHQHKKHGLEDMVDEILNSGINFLIMPDAGSFDGAYFPQFVDAGIEILILDHHQLPQDYDMDKETPSNVVVINNQLSPDYPNKYLCGAGVVYKFCQILDEILAEPRADQFLDLVALGEVSDVMFQGSRETRYLIYEGLNRIKNQGFIEMIQAQSYSLGNKSRYPYNLNAIDTAFYISPLINSITRVGTTEEKELLFQAFVDPLKVLKSTKRGAGPNDTETVAEQCARTAINVKNRQNKIKEKAIDVLETRAQKEGMLENNLIFISIEEEDNIPQELTGLIAQYFVSKYKRPCIVGRPSDDGFVKGSMRNDERSKALPYLKPFLEDSDLMDYVRGHMNASGTSIASTKIDSLIDYANDKLDRNDFINYYLVDGIYDAKDKSLRSIGRFFATHDGCFGNGVTEAKFVIRNIPTSSLFIMGANQSSSKLTCNSISYVKFNDTNFIDSIQMGNNTHVTVYGKFSINEYRGMKTLQFGIEDYDFEEQKMDDDGF